MKEELGLIRKAFLGYEEHGLFTFQIEFDFGVSMQGFGNYVIGVKKGNSEFHHPYGESTDIRNIYGAEALMRLLDAVGVNSWDELVGRECWVRRNSEGIIEEVEAPAYRKHSGAFNIKEFFDEKKKQVS